MGICTGVLSSCGLAGYALESKLVTAFGIRHQNWPLVDYRCHLGKSSVYDTVSKLNWSADVRTHRIGVVIEQLLSSDWEEGKPVPEAFPEDDCVVRNFLVSQAILCPATHSLFDDLWRNVIPGIMVITSTQRPLRPQCLHTQGSRLLIRPH